MLTVWSRRSEKQGDAGVNYAAQKNLLRQVRFPLLDYDVTLGGFTRAAEFFLKNYLTSKIHKNSLAIANDSIKPN